MLEGTVILIKFDRTTFQLNSHEQIVPGVMGSENLSRMEDDRRVVYFRWVIWNGKQ